MQCSVLHLPAVLRCLVSNCVVGLSKEDTAVAILRGKKLAALGLTAIMAQAQAASDSEGCPRTPTLQHATQEALVSCIQALIGEHQLSSALTYLLLSTSNMVGDMCADHTRCAQVRLSGSSRALSRPTRQLLQS